jgi:peroxiredoxin
MAVLMKAKITFGLVALAIAIAAFLFLFPRQSAPEVRFVALSGENFSTSDLRGKVVVVNFWATYCGPCLKEMPHMVETHRKFAARGYETVAVAVRRDNPLEVARLVESRALPFRIALDSSGEVAREFGKVRITPTLVVIGRDGTVLQRYVGKTDWAELHRLLERALSS